MKIVKLIVLALTLNLGSAFAGCVIDLGSKAADQNDTKISICTEAGKSVVEGLSGLTADEQKSFQAQVQNCKCDIDGNELTNADDANAAHCASQRSIDIDEATGKISVKVEATNVTVE